MLSITSETAFLLSPFSHPAALHRTRGLLIISRVKQVAKLCALLTIFWVVADAALLPRPLWGLLAVERVIACTGFLMICMVDIQPKLYWAFILLVSTFAIVLVFLLITTHYLQLHTFGNSYSRYAAVYYFSPFVLAAGVGFFPLTLIEVTFLLVAPIVITMFLYVGLFQGTVPGGMGYELLWVLVLTLATSSMASISQIGFLLELFRDTAYDQLTGLLLRNIGGANISQQVAAAVRNNNTYSVLFLDIDNFKKINDSFGHDAGDHVIGVVGGRLKLMLRQQDVAVRWGGEEFLIALPNTNKDQAGAFLERLAIKGLDIGPNGAPITASFGIAEVQADRAKDFQSLVTLADNRLYAAKRAGKNCYVAQDAACLWLKQ